MDREDAEFPFAPTLRNLVQSFAGEPARVDDVIWIPNDDVWFELRHAEGSDEWEVVRSERDGVPRRLLRALAEHAEQFLVWSLATAARRRHQRRSRSYPVAPRVPVPDGPLSVEETDE